MVDRPDIDIDVSDRVHALKDHPYVQCSLLQDGILRPHPTGVCYQDAPTDPLTKAMSFPSGGKDTFDYAALMGFYKIDILHSRAYDNVRDREHLKSLLRDIDWDLFKRKDIVERLQQIGSHFDIVDAYEPKSIDDLACIVAIIRPGKMWLIGQPMEFVRSEIWKKDGSGYSFKKSHAYAYAMCICVQAMSLDK